MNITINASSDNKKTILSLLEDQGYKLPCNCHGAHHCNGEVYSFDCSMIPDKPVSITLPSHMAQTLSGISLEDRIPTAGPGNTLLIDLGTTTVAMALIDRTTAELRKTVVFENPQRRHGSDVISRIQSSLQGEGKDLKREITSAIKKHASLLCAENEQTQQEITDCLIAGNTAMIHLLMGYDCSPLAKSPFVPTETSPAPFRHGSCDICILPWFSAFVGGDITAGIYACGMEEPAGSTTLLIDLGTNGEMILRHDGHFYSAATAAGPAFEGNGLSCGSPAIPGAIRNVRLRKLRPALDTIGNKLPTGICGSGAVSLCAEILRHGYMTKEGILTSHFPPDGILLGYSPSHTPLLFTAEDLRNIQLSVAAIAAGIDTLTREAGISPSDISSAYLGGGFGFYLDPDACRELGLFSSLPVSRIRPMGNTCLRGLFRCACEPDTPTLLTRPSAHLVSLADHPYFRQQFVAHMTYSG